MCNNLTAVVVAKSKAFASLVTTHFFIFNVLLHFFLFLSYSVILVIK